METAISTIVGLAGTNITIVLSALAISALAYVIRYFLDLAIARRTQVETVQRDDAWKLYEATKTEVMILRKENKHLYLLYREALAYHLEAQTVYTASMAHVRGYIHTLIEAGKIQCPQPHCPVRAAIDAETDRIVAESTDKANQSFRAWIQATTAKDRPPEE